MDQMYNWRPKNSLLSLSRLEPIMIIIMTSCSAKTVEKYSKVLHIHLQVREPFQCQAVPHCRVKSSGVRQSKIYTCLEGAHDS